MNVSISLVCASLGRSRLTRPPAVICFLIESDFQYLDWARRGSDLSIFSNAWPLSLGAPSSRDLISCLFRWRKALNFRRLSSTWCRLASTAVIRNVGALWVSFQLRSNLRATGSQYRSE